MPELLEQMTWAINQGGPQAGGKQEVFEFLTNIGWMIAAAPARTHASRPPVQPYANDLLPLIQQMAWLIAQPGTTEITFLKTVAYYFSTSLKITTGPYLMPTTPPIPPALQYMPNEDLDVLYQIMYWMINEGTLANPKARAFLEAVGYYLFLGAPRTFAGPYRYPK